MGLRRTELWELWFSIFKFTLYLAPLTKNKRGQVSTPTPMCTTYSVYLNSPTWKHNTLFCAAHYLHAKGLTACQWTMDYLRLSILDVHIHKCSGDKRPYLRPCLQVKRRGPLILDIGQKSHVLPLCSVQWWNKRVRALKEVKDGEKIKKDARSRQLPSAPGAEFRHSAHVPTCAVVWSAAVITSFYTFPGVQSAVSQDP